MEKYNENYSLLPSLVSSNILTEKEITQSGSTFNLYDDSLNISQTNTTPTEIPKDKESETNLLLKELLIQFQKGEESSKLFLKALWKVFIAYNQERLILKKKDGTFVNNLQQCLCDQLEWSKKEYKHWTDEIRLYIMFELISQWLPEYKEQLKKWGLRRFTAFTLLLGQNKKNFFTSFSLDELVKYFEKEENKSRKETTILVIQTSFRLGVNLRDDLSLLVKSKQIKDLTTLTLENFKNLKSSSKRKETELNQELNQDEELNQDDKSNQEILQHEELNQDEELNQEELNQDKELNQEQEEQLSDDESQMINSTIIKKKQRKKKKKKVNSSFNNINSEYIPNNNNSILHSESINTTSNTLPQIPIKQKQQIFFPRFFHLVKYFGEIDIEIRSFLCESENEDLKIKELQQKNDPRIHFLKQESKEFFEWIRETYFFQENCSILSEMKLLCFYMPVHFQEILLNSVSYFSEKNALLKEQIIFKFILKMFLCNDQLKKNLAKTLETTFQQKQEKMDFLAEAVIKSQENSFINQINSSVKKQTEQFVSTIFKKIEQQISKEEQENLQQSLQSEIQKFSQNLEKVTSQYSTEVLLKIWLTEKCVESNFCEIAKRKFEEEKQIRKLALEKVKKEELDGFLN